MFIMMHLDSFVKMFVSQTSEIFYAFANRIFVKSAIRKIVI